MSFARLIFIGLILMLGGCQYFKVQSSQLVSLKNALFPAPEKLLNALWSVEFGGYSSVVQPVVVEKATVFVNDIDAISFNGWTITRVSGLPSFNPEWKIQDLGNQRQFLVNGQIVATHKCDPWLKYDSQAGVRFEQHCLGKQAYTNTILVDSLGQITDIEQVVDSSFMVLSLRMNN